MVKRDFRKDPVTFEELTHCRWYTVVDDLIGGYAVSNVNKNSADMNVYDSEFEIASFIHLPIAEHLVKLHNAWWDAVIWESYYDNIMEGIAMDMANYYHDEQAPLPDGVLPLTEDEWFDYDDDHEAT